MLSTRLPGFLECPGSPLVRAGVEPACIGLPASPKIPRRNDAYLLPPAEGGRRRSGVTRWPEPRASCLDAGPVPHFTRTHREPSGKTIVAGPLGLGVHSAVGVTLAGVRLPVAQPHDVGQYDPVPVHAGQLGHTEQPPHGAVQAPPAAWHPEQLWQLEQPDPLEQLEQPPPREPRQCRASAFPVARETARAAAIRNNPVVLMRHLRVDGTERNTSSGGRTCTCDLLVMSQASCCCSTPE